MKATAGQIIDGDVWRRGDQWMHVDTAKRETPKLGGPIMRLRCHDDDGIRYEWTVPADMAVVIVDRRPTPAPLVETADDVARLLDRLIGAPWREWSDEAVGALGWFLRHCVQQVPDLGLHGTEQYIEGVPFGAHVKVGDGYAGRFPLHEDDEPVYRLVPAPTAPADPEG